MFPSLLAILFLLSSSSLGQQQQQEGVEKALRRLRDSVDRFEANFHRAIEDYGKAGLVRTLLEERASHHFRLDDQSAMDFPAAVARTEGRLQAFFDAKIGAIRKLVTVAERSAARVDIGEGEAPASLSDRECLQHLRLLNRSSLKNGDIWERVGRGELGGPRPGVHIATESYKCSGPIARDFNWTGRPELDEQMAENGRQDATIARQYIGTYNGLTRTFPGFHWDIGTSEQFAVDLFDPRFRPWFVAAESAPRDILFLMDFSGSAKGLNAHLIKVAVMAVLQTLTPNDFFAGIWYNSRQQRVLANCTEPADTFIQATSRNKLLFRRFLDRVEERDQATLPAALEMAFGEFLRARNISTGSAPPRRSGGHRMVLLFTDGIEFWPTDVVERIRHEHPSEPVRVFGHSMGYGRGPQAALAWLTCQTRAGPAQAVIGSIAEVRLKARAYLRKLNELLALAYRDKARNAANRPISWPNPYMDVQRGGPVLTLSMPILGAQPRAYRQPSGEDMARDEKGRKQQAEGEAADGTQLDGFVGVAGIDVGFAALAKALALDGEPDPGQAYAFLVDNNGLVFYHPKLQTPSADIYAVRRTLCHRLSTFLRTNTRVPFSRADELVLQQMGYLDSIPQMDILQLEEDDALMRRFRTNLVLGRCGEILEDDRRQLRCFSIRGTPLVAGFVLRKRRPKIVLRKPRRGDDGQQRGEEAEEGEEMQEEDPFELAERLRTALIPPPAVNADKDGHWAERKNGTKSSSASALGLPPSVGLLLREDQLQQSPLLSPTLRAAKVFDRFGRLLQLLPSAASSSLLAPFLAHLSALGPDSVFPAWASKWRGEAAACPPPPPAASPLIPSRPPPAPFVSAFLELRSSALVGQPGLMAIYPRCELASIKSFLRAAPAAEEDSAKLTVQVDPDKDGGLMMMTVEQRLGIVDGSRSVARVGVQLRGSYLQQKLLRAMQQPGDGWAECAASGGTRKCLLVNADSFVLATSGSAANSPGTFRPIHLSQLEPELFAELQTRGLIRKMSWRDPTGLCPMVMELRQRQQHFPVTYYMQQQPAEPASSAQPLHPSTLGHLLKLLSSWADFLLPLPVLAALSQSPDQIVPLEEAADCEIEPQPELIEHCTVERSRFRLKARPKERKGGDGQQGKTATALWLRDKNCNRTVGLLPFDGSELFLFLLDGQCQNNNGAGPLPFVSHVQVPNCNLTMESLSLERRARTDLDYSRSHPKEINPICTSTATGHFANKGLVLTFFLFIVFSSIHFCIINP